MSPRRRCVAISRLFGFIQVLLWGVKPRPSVLYGWYFVIGGTSFQNTVTVSEGAYTQDLVLSSICSFLRTITFY